MSHEELERRQLEGEVEKMLVAAGASKTRHLPFQHALERKRNKNRMKVFEGVNTHPTTPLASRRSGNRSGAHPLPPLKGFYLPTNSRAFQLTCLIS